MATRVRDGQHAAPELRRGWARWAA